MKRSLFCLAAIALFAVASESRACPTGGTIISSSFRSFNSAGVLVEPAPLIIRQRATVIEQPLILGSGLNVNLDVGARFGGFRGVRERTVTWRFCR